MLKRLLRHLGFAPASTTVLELTSPRSEKQLPTVNLFASEPWLLDVAKNAIQQFEVPWLCDEALKQEAKAEALNCIVGGVKSKAFLKQLVPAVFKTRRDASHGIAKISACGWEAISRFRYKGLVKRFQWNYCEPICDFPEHAKLDWKTFSIEKGHKGEFPASRYGCRCRSSAHFEDD